jgi:hypothetical protein
MGDVDCWGQEKNLQRYPKEKIITEKTIVFLEELSFVLDKLEEKRLSDLQRLSRKDKDDLMSKRKTLFMYLAI